MTIWPTNQASRPLKGLRVLDLSRILAGPYCSMLLADLGADVIKIEPPGGDETRHWGPPFFVDAAAYFFVANRNKWDLVLDLRSDSDREKLIELVREAHFVLHNFTDDVARRLSVDFNSISDMNPNVNYVTISGFGSSEPNRRGYDILAQGLSGLMSITGETDRPPQKVGTAISDISAGMFAALAIAASWAGKEKGRRIDVSLYDASIALLGNQAMNFLLAGVEPNRLGNSHPNVQPYGSFETRKGQIIIGVGTDGQFRSLCDALELTALTKDVRFENNKGRVECSEDLRKILENKLATRTAIEWASIFERADVPSALVRSVAQALSSPESHSISGVERASGEWIPQILSPFQFDGEYLKPYLAPPKLNEHHERIFPDEVTH